MTIFNVFRTNFSPNAVRHFLFFIVVFLLTRQIPFLEYSSIMNIATLGFAIYPLVELVKSILKRKEQFSVLIVTCLILFLILSIYSIAHGNEPLNILKWLIIFSVLLIAYKVSPREYFVITFICLIIIQAIFIDAILLLMTTSFTLDNYSVIRQYVGLNDWGDVYTFDGIFWFVKLRGSGLLPVGLFVSYLYLKGRIRIIALIILIPSIIVSNTAFVFVSLIFFTILLFIRIRWTVARVIGVLTILLLIALPLNSVVSKVISDKDSSMDVRYDQFDVLVNDFTKLNSDILFGTGLGHTLSVDSPVRDYTGNIYFEMQPIYVLNQLGFVVFSLYIFIHVILAKVFIREKELLLLYCCYVLYASSNPYIFDTSHFVVIVVLVSLRKIIDERNLCRSSGLQPQIR
jgi:hypothetical protein